MLSECTVTEVVAFLEKWQTLLGALLGGVIALGVALIVARSATRREERISAILLISDLMAVRAAAENLVRIAEEQKVSQENYPIWVSEKLSWRRPRLSTLFESNMARVVNLDARLSAHLSLFKIAYTSLEEHIVRVAEDAERLLTKGSPEIPRSSVATAADARAAAGALALAAKHAAYAEYLLSAFVLSRLPAFVNRIRMRACPNELDRESKKLLTDGRI